MDLVSKEYERGWTGLIDDEGMTISRIVRGVKEEGKINSQIINRIETQNLDNIAVKLQELFGKGNKPVFFVNSAGTVSGIAVFNNFPTACTLSCGPPTGRWGKSRITVRKLNTRVEVPPLYKGTRDYHGRNV